jgi:hypothetical protein
MKGNFHVRFLEEGERVIALSYSTALFCMGINLPWENMVIVEITGQIKNKSL